MTLFIACAFLALAEEDGKYRPEVTTKVPVVPVVVPVTTTIRPRWNDPRWNDPRFNSDPRWAGQPGWNNWNYNRYNTTWNDYNKWGNRWDTRYNVDGKLLNLIPSSYFTKESLYQLKADQSLAIQTGVLSAWTRRLMPAVTSTSTRQSEEF